MSDHQNTPEPEPSVWDHFVSKLHFRLRQTEESETDTEVTQAIRFPWLTFVAVVLALVAQLTLEPSPARSPWPGIILYGVAAICLTLAVIQEEFRLIPHRPEVASSIKPNLRIEFLLLGLLMAVMSFLLFGSGEFDFLNLTVWVLSIMFVFQAFRERSPGKSFRFKAFWNRIREEELKIQFKRWTLIFLAAVAVILFFNFHRLASVPPEMVSDQAEKLLDINDILHGQTPVYFTRNTGREVIHFYLTAAYMALFNLDVSFLNLKVVAVLANLLTLLFIYLVGKEFSNKWVGLGAAVFAGMAYWPLLFTRLALRIPYYPLFVGPVLYFMLRGLRRQHINDILLAGLFLGLGLHGYTPFRIVPIFVVIGMLIYMLHKPGNKRLLESLFVLILIAFVSLIVFIPLLRFWLSYPDLFAYRAFSRLTGMEVSFQAHPLAIFFQNFWKASVMFFWDNGVIWAHSIPGRPALEVVSGALYFLGIISLLIRFFRKRNWMDLFLLVSIPMLLMPSILSLAYPGENPSLNRSAGVVVPVFVVLGIALETILRTVKESLDGKIGKYAVVALSSVFLIWSASNNYELVFNKYYQIYRASSWNSSEIGKVAAFFIESMGSPDSTYVVGYPHWVDSRLVAINAGYPGRDFVIFPEQIPETANQVGPKLFFLNVNDSENMQLLLETFEDGVLSQYDSEVVNKDFMIFFVPPTQGALH
ncbi:MAG: glycosyltransferase family 39 protein [Brevefilum sp.]